MEWGGRCAIDPPAAHVREAVAAFYVDGWGTRSSGVRPARPATPVKVVAGSVSLRSARTTSRTPPFPSADGEAPHVRAADHDAARGLGTLGLLVAKAAGSATAGQRSPAAGGLRPPYEWRPPTASRSQRLVHRFHFQGHMLPSAHW